MFNAEKLFGKILGEIVGGSGKKSRGLADSLTSGAGLMTIIGLGVGAVEILTDRKKQQASGAPPVSGSIPQPPVGGRPAPPPPMLGSRSSSAPPNLAGQAVPPVIPPLPGSQTAASRQGEKLARRMIQVMIAAAQTDGVMDDNEKQTILQKLDSQGLDAEEKEFLITEMDNPLPMAQLTAGVNDPATCRAMYMLAVSAITIDTPEEQGWLDTLAGQLSISGELKDSIEKQYA